MKFLCLLTVTVSLTSGAIIPNLGVEPHANNLQRRKGGNVPGDRHYNPYHDPLHTSNGGRYSRKELEKQHTQAIAKTSRPLVAAPYRGADGYTRERDSTGSHHTFGIEGDKYDTYFRGGYFRPPHAPLQGTGLITQGSPRNVPFIGEYLSPGTDASAAPPFQIGARFGSGPVYAEVFHSFKRKPKLIDVRDPKPRTWYKTEHGELAYRDKYGDIRSVHDDYHLWGVKKLYKLPDKRSDVHDDALFDSDNTVSTTSNPSNPNALTQAEWQMYYYEFQRLQANATKLLAPILDNLIKKSNTTSAYEMAWSIETQLLGYPTILTGPYLNGLTNFEPFENTWLLQKGFVIDMDRNIFQPANQTLSNTTLLEAAQMLTVNEYFKFTYYDTWNASVKAVNVTSPGSNQTVLENLVYLASVITSTNDTTIVPQSFFTANVTASKAHSVRWTQLIAQNH